MHTFASWLEWWFGRMKRMKINEMDKKKKGKEKKSNKKTRIIVLWFFLFFEIKKWIFHENDWGCEIERIEWFFGHEYWNQDG